MGLVKKDILYIGCCAFVMPMILFCPAYGASSVRSLGKVASVTQNTIADALTTSRTSSLPIVAAKKGSATQTGSKTVNSVDLSSDAQRMPFGVHVSSTSIPTSTSSDISAAQQRVELMERTGELEERAGNVEDRVSDLEERTEEIEFRASDLEGRANSLETDLGNANTEITNLKTKGAAVDASIQSINTVLSGKQKSLKGGNYISITDSGDGSTSTVSATYAAGSNISIATDGKISVSDVLPAQRLTGNNGSNGQVLQSNGNGGMAWVDAPSTSKVRNANGEILYDMWVDTGN